MTVKRVQREGGGGEEELSLSTRGVETSGIGRREAIVAEEEELNFQRKEKNLGILESKQNKQEVQKKG